MLKLLLSTLTVVIDDAIAYEVLGADQHGEHRRGRGQRAADESPRRFAASSAHAIKTSTTTHVTLPRPRPPSAASRSASSCGGC
jgi:hypothetical protein